MNTRSTTNLRQVNSLNAVSFILAKSAVWLVVGMALAGNSLISLAGDTIPTPIRHQIERSRPASINVPMKRGEWIDLQLQYFDYNVPTRLTGVEDIVMVLTAGPVTNSYAARIIDATNGLVGFMITPTNLWVSNNYTWEMPVCGASSTAIRAYGTISVTPAIGYQGLTNTPPPMNTFDLATCILYNAGLAPWPLYSFFTSGTANLDINNLTVHGTLTGVDGGQVIGRDGAPGVSPTIVITNTLVGDAAVTNLGTSTNLILQFTLPEGSPDGQTGGGITTNINIFYTTNIIISTVSITNIGGSSGGAGSFTNVQINSISHGAAIAIGDSETTTWTQGTDGVWRVNSWSSNGLEWVIADEHIGGVYSNGIILRKGTLQLYEEDLDCNVRLYDGSRLVPSLTFNGHTNDWGLYGRGYNGSTIAGWSVAGTEVGLLHGAGITLMNTNFAFSGTHIGDLSGGWGYPEPIFNSWKTNMSFSTLVLSNLTVTPGSFQIKDTYNTDRAMLDTTGFSYKDAGGITRATIGSEIQIKQGNGLTVTKLNTSGFSTIDAVSQMPLVTIGVGAWDLYSVMSSNGKTNILFNSFSGLRLWDPFQYVLRSTLSYTGIELLDVTGLIKFKSDTVSGMTTIANASITNSGNLAFYGANGTNLCTITGSTGAIKIRGVDSDTRYPLAPTAMTAFVATNIIGTVTQRLWYTAQGVVTNHIP
jgi:hypothetical protein